LTRAPPSAQQQSLRAIRHLETAVAAAPEIEGLALRYGSLYGPGASADILAAVRRRAFPLVGRGEGVWSFLHVDDAAAATVAALDHGTPGVYNICDDDPAPVSSWLPHLAEVIGAPPPRRVPVWLARLVAGEVAVSLMTRVRGSANARARRELGWTPTWPTWRDGFRDGLWSTTSQPSGDLQGRAGELARRPSGGAPA
jgi:nucleoside-diphosphate-sugar epimerase